MGRIRFVLYKISKLLPRSYRKPFILISSIIGLLIFFNILVDFTRSIYLLSIKNALVDVQRIFQNNGSLGVVIIFICIFGTWMSFKYYKSLQTGITMCYVIVLILAFLPMVI